VTATTYKPDAAKTFNVTLTDLLPADGTADQYLAGNATWQTLPAVPTVNNAAFNVSLWGAAATSVFTANASTAGTLNITAASSITSGTAQPPTSGAVYSALAGKLNNQANPANANKFYAVNADGDNAMIGANDAVLQNIISNVINNSNTTNSITTLAKKFVSTLTNVTGTTFVVAHNLNTLTPVVQVYSNGSAGTVTPSTLTPVLASWTINSVNQITINFDVAPNENYLAVGNQFDSFVQFAEQWVSALSTLCNFHFQ
jgi:hypothetical protein